jgi:type 1 glutamine amidotransferase
MNILVLCDDYWHPGKVPREGLERLEGGEFHFEWIEDAREWSAERMANYPVTLLTKSNNVSAADQTPWMAESVQEAFAKYVREGNGLLAVHSGTAEYEHTAILRGILGGVFTHHPERCPVTVEPLEGHLLTLASSPFTLVDEHYFMALDDTQADVFLTTRSTHGVQPGAWQRKEGAGRVAVITPGHTLEVWLHPSYQALLTNCLRWCGPK